jgi:hypothetical protein
VEHRGKPHFGIDHAVVKHVFDEFEGHPLQRFRRLHHRGGVEKPFEVFRQVSALGATVEPGCQIRRVGGR